MYILTLITVALLSFLAAGFLGSIAADWLNDRPDPRAAERFAANEAKRAADDEARSITGYSFTNEWGDTVVVPPRK